MKLTREIIWNIWIMMVDWKPPRNLLEKRWQKVFLSAEGYGGMAGVAKSCKEPTLMSMFVLFCFWKSWTFQYDKDQSVRFSEQFLHAVPIILECFLTYLSMVFHIFPMFFVVFVVGHIPDDPRLFNRCSSFILVGWPSWMSLVVVARAPRWGPQPSKQR